MKVLKRVIMRQFMDRACRAKPPATAADFVAFIRTMFHYDISIRTAQLWLKILGYKYRKVDMKELYNDGHNRPDVKQALADYTLTMQKIAQKQYQYHSDNMESVEKPYLGSNGTRTVVYYHDESSCHAKDVSPRSYRRDGVTGRMKDKSRRELAMIAAYCCADFGMSTTYSHTMIQMF